MKLFYVPTGLEHNSLIDSALSFQTPTTSPTTGGGTRPRFFSQEHYLEFVQSSLYTVTNRANDLREFTTSA